jgi:uroporphyrinogen-III synthase
MTILVTRPEPQATQWVQALLALGEQADALPLISISAPAKPEAVEQAWHALPELRLVMFVSPNAAQWFANLRPQGALWPKGTLAAAPGPGTAQVVQTALATSGLGADHIITPGHDCDQFDSEHLWPLLAPLDWQGQRVLIISGGDSTEARGRTWLTEQWQARGATVQAVLTYQRQAADWPAPQQALADQAWQHPTEHLWLFSSSEAIEHLHKKLGAPPACAQALTTHPKVAEKARAAGFTTVMSCKPTPEAVAQARRSAATWQL